VIKIHKSIVFRKILPEDLRTIYSEGLNEPEFSNLPIAWCAENITKVFTSESAISFAAMSRKKVIGFILGSTENEKSCLHWIMVNEKFRKKSVGSELLRLFIEDSRSRGIENFLTSPVKNSHKIINFFSNNGFNVKETYIEFYR
jgi:GNAT superfamily N-acetyltransferase